MQVKGLAPLLPFPGSSGLGELARKESRWPSGPGPGGQCSCPSQLMQARDLRRAVPIDPEGGVWSGLAETIFPPWILKFIDLVHNYLMLIMRMQHDLFSLSVIDTRLIILCYYETVYTK